MARSLTNVKLGVVVTTCAGREENLRRTISYLAATDPRPDILVVVFDGVEPVTDLAETEFKQVLVKIVKHAPGQEQPRNVGVRHLRESLPDATHVWFLDSDLVFRSDILLEFERAYSQDPITQIIAPDRRQVSGPSDLHRVLLGPYDWLAPEVYEPVESSHNDIRWPSFKEHGPSVALVHDLGAALGCFGGNLVWPIDEFQDVGGFHPQLSHGRVEDGELGLRAAAAGVPMSLVADARAWHVAHNVNSQWCLATNRREVPLLNSWHPWVEERGLILTESDGARFDFRCTEPDCGLIMNAHDHWLHLSQHRSGEPFTFNDPASVRPADA